jgi:hypothetical protein
MNWRLGLIFLVVLVVVVVGVRMLGGRGGRRP